MTTLTFAEMANLVDAKASEMKESLDTLLKSNVSDNTKRTQKFQRSSAIHQLLVFKAVLETVPDTEIVLGDDLEKWFTSMTTLTSVRKAKYTIEVHRGDKVMDLLEKYEDVNNIYNKLKKAAEEAGLTIDYSVPGGILR